VRYDDLTYEVIVGGSTPYGMIVDANDRIWKANGTMSRYDPQTQEWQTNSCGQGCTALAQSPEGDIWLGGVSGDPYIVINADPETMEVVGGLSVADVPGLSMPWGLSFDAEGYLWAIEMGTQVYKIDVETGEHWIFDNNTSMYTYSDFTGFGLANVAGDPG
jgi:streptogramin lyase